MPTDAVAMMPSRTTRTLAHAARRSARPWLCGCSTADLLQEGALAWLRLLARHEATRAQVATYAEPRIQGAIQDALRAATHKGHVQYVPLGPVHAAPLRDADVLLLRQVRRAVNQLPRRLRSVVIRRYWRGWTQARIARGLGCTESRVCQLERQARAMLRPVLRALVTAEATP